MNRSLKVLPIGAVSIFSSLLLASPSFAATSTTSGDQPYPPPEPDEGGWFHYQYHLPEDARIRTIQGTSNGDGVCHFEDGASLAPDEDVISAQEVAYNPDTCESRIATSDAPIGGAESPPAERGDAGAEEQAEPEDTQPSSDSPEAQQTRSSGHLWSWYEDPPGIKVTEVDNRTAWSWDGSDVLSSPPPTGGETIDYFTASGWALEEQDRQNSHNSDRTTSSTYAHFRNGVFCLGITTHVHADRNAVHGEADGTLDGNWNWSRSGGCNALLSFNNQLERTQN